MHIAESGKLPVCILMDIESKVGYRPIRIRNLAESICRTTRNKSSSRCPVCSWKKNEMFCGTVCKINDILTTRVLKFVRTLPNG